MKESQTVFEKKFGILLYLPIKRLEIPLGISRNSASPPLWGASGNGFSGTKWAVLKDWIAGHSHKFGEYFTRLFLNR